MWIQGVFLSWASAANVFCVFSTGMKDIRPSFMLRGIGVSWMGNDFHAHIWWPWPETRTSCGQAAVMEKVMLLCALQMPDLYMPVCFGVAHTKNSRSMFTQ